MGSRWERDRPTNKAKQSYNREETERDKGGRGHPPEGLGNALGVYSTTISRMERREWEITKTMSILESVSLASEINRERSGRKWAASGQARPKHA